MGKITDWVVMPHPPVVLEKVGGPETSKVQATAHSMKEIAKRLITSGVTTTIIVSPHGPLFEDAIALNGKEVLKGDLKKFGAKDVEVTWENNIDIVNSIERKAVKAKISTVVLNDKMAKTYGVGLELDHGAVVPLHFLKEAGYHGKIVSVTMGLLEPLELYNLGRIIQEVVMESEEQVAFIASGDLSHRLTSDAPAGYSPQGKEFDAKVVEALQQGDIKVLWNLDEDLIEGAGECGFRPIVILFGSTDGAKLKGEVLSYEGPFGVGYLVAHMKQVGEKSSLYQELKDLDTKKLESSRREESLPVKIARETIENYIKFGEILEVKDVPQELSGKGGVFVSLKKGGQLRGCIGTIEASQLNLLQEIQTNAISASTKDPRFWPIEAEELAKLTYSVDILGPIEPIDSPEELDVKNYGLIVERGSQRGLLLPDLPGVDTVEDQVRIAMEKAGIPQGQEVKLFRFRVTRYN